MIASGAGSKLIIAAGLIIAGIIILALDESDLGTVLVTSGLTLGGWAQGLHTPTPNESAGEGE